MCAPNRRIPFADAHWANKFDDRQQAKLHKPTAEAMAFQALQRGTKSRRRGGSDDEDG